MQVRNARDLGLLIKDQRRSLSLSQADLADKIGASRHWVMGVEAGKPTVELGLVLKALSALGLVCNLRPAGTFASNRGLDPRPGSSPDSPDLRASRPLSLDLSRILSQTRASGRTHGAGLEIEP
jgi:HTH-type transcriptional regulator/antitoxin HipB